MVVYCADGPAMGRQIYSINPQGVGPPKQWTNGTDAFIECPKLSPCGRYILYTSCGFDFHSDLIIIDVTTGDEAVITPSGNDGIYGDFSHDGTKIVGAVGTFGWPLDLWTMDYDGGNPTQLTHGADAWAPEYNFDDTKIYYSEFMSSQIFICNAATGETEQYTDNGTWNDDPVGSPDGSQIAWATMYELPTGRHIYISPVESWYPPDKEIGFETYIRSPCFSPDGTKLIFDHGGMAASELAIYDLQDDTWWDITDNVWGDYMADWAHMVPY
jgi:Tol biopolymer transport system component